MGCFLALLALISPRLVLFLLWIFSDVLVFVILAFLIDVSSYAGGRRARDARG